jgi:hypothetical protein
MPGSRECQLNQSRDGTTAMSCIKSIPVKFNHIQDKINNMAKSRRSEFIHPLFEHILGNCKSKTTQAWNMQLDQFVYTAVHVKKFSARQQQQGSPPPARRPFFIQSINDQFKYWTNLLLNCDRVRDWVCSVFGEHHKYMIHDMLTLKWTSDRLPSEYIANFHQFWLVHAR